jgi:hypothetical protein
MSQVVVRRSSVRTMPVPRFAPCGSLVPIDILLLGLVSLGRSAFFACANGSHKVRNKPILYISLFLTLLYKFVSLGSYSLNNE